MRRGALFLVLLSQTVGGAVVSDGALLLFVVFTTLCIASLTRLDARRRTRIALPNFQGAVPHFLRKRGLSYYVSVFLQIDKSHFSEKHAFFYKKSAFFRSGNLMWCCVKRKHHTRNHANTLCALLFSTLARCSFGVAFMIARSCS